MNFNKFYNRKLTIKNKYDLFIVNISFINNWFNKICLSSHNYHLSKWEWIEMNWNGFRNIDTNVKMNAFQSWMHFYSFIGIAWSTSLCLSKIILAFSVHTTNIMNTVQFKILNRKFFNPIEPNWIQLNPKKSIRYLKYSDSKKLIHLNPFSFANISFKNL